MTSLTRTSRMGRFWSSYNTRWQGSVLLGAVAATDQTASVADPEKARALINAGLPEMALRYLPESDKSVRTRQVRALALLKSDRVEAAMEVLEQLKSEGNLDGETLGLLAGRYKQRWEKTQIRLWFNAALEAYRSAWEGSKPPNPYLGINAASMLLWDGQVEESAKLTTEVSAAINSNSSDFWDLATLAESYLLQGDPEKALRFYSKMLATGPERYENICSARRTLRRNLKHLSVPADKFEKLLTLPTVVAFVGHDVDAPDRAVPRFPPHREPEVRKLIADALMKLEVMYGASSASAGADIIFLEEMKKRNAYVRVILPCARGPFMREFLSSEWQSRFEAAMDHPRAEIVEITAGDPEDLWKNFQPELWKKSVAQAKQLDELPTLLTV